jgi:hypothetical protein
MVQLTEDMFGGPHRNDEMTRTEQLGWSTTNRTAIRRSARLTTCRYASGQVSTDTQEAKQTVFDPAAFVRHVTYVFGTKCHPCLESLKKNIWIRLGRWASRRAPELNFEKNVAFIGAGFRSVEMPGRCGKSHFGNFRCFPESSVRIRTRSKSGSRHSDLAPNCRSTRRRAGGRSCKLTGPTITCRRRSLRARTVVASCDLKLGDRIDDSAFGVHASDPTELSPFARIRCTNSQMPHAN